MGNEPQERMRKVGRWIDAEMRRVWYRQRWAYRWRRWAYRREWLSASVVGVVVNGSQRLGLGLGLDCRESCCQSRREWSTTIGFGFGFGLSRMVRNDWVWVWVQTITNGYRQRFGSYQRRWGSTTTGFGSEAWRWGFIGFWFQKNKKGQIWQIGFWLSFWYIY